MGIMELAVREYTCTINTVTEMENHPSVHPAVNGYLTHFHAGEGEGGEEEEWRPTSVTQLSV